MKFSISTINTIVAVIFTGLFLVMITIFFNRYLRAKVITDCYNTSFYQTEYQQDSKTITTREPQNWVFRQCLKYQNVNLPDSK